MKRLCAEPLREVVCVLSLYPLQPGYSRFAEKVGEGVLRIPSQEEGDRRVGGARGSLSFACFVSLFSTLVGLY